MDRGSHVVVVAGPTCTGKSTLAKALSEELSAVLLSQDDILTEIIPDSDRNLRDRLKSYDEMFKRARQAFREGKGVILEGTFSRIEHRAGVIRSLPTADFVIAELEVPLETALDRFAKREGHPAIDQTDEIVRDRNAEYPYSDFVLRIDGTKGVENQLSLIIDATANGIAHDVVAWKKLGANRPEAGRVF